MIKAVIGIGIIVASFGDILKNPGKSMMDTLMEDRQKKFDAALEQAKAEQAAKEAEAAAAEETVSEALEETIPE